MTWRPDSGAAARAALGAVRLHDDSGFLGSGFLVSPTEVLTSAHLIARGRAPLAVGRRGERLSVVPGSARLFPADPGEGRFHAHPDLALVRLERPVDPPELTLDGGDGPSAGTAVAVHGFSPYTPAPGVQPDSLLLEVVGPSGGYVRLRGDEVKDGFSGSMVVRLDDGRVCGVLKGSRDYDGVRGGWYTPLSALAGVLPSDDPLQAALRPGARAAGRPVRLSGPVLVEALEAVVDMDDPDFRRQVLRQAADRLDPNAPLRVPYRAHPRDHVVEIVRGCQSHRDPEAALDALARAVEFLRPGERAAERLRELVEGGSW